jgi:hypothetical protein
MSADSEGSESSNKSGKKNQYDLSGGSRSDKKGQGN